ncbi:hypothetical protein ACJ73_09627 [Blastomyces percursus]|uniref:Uncharacterized protein n=1 Tax=Blastomyces percursus TaxID=1658174 RepID=A0A1J9P3U2_9EURO|nr:hypothetical protein ACJ73_09627 [Blastomyces percursus]
MQALTAHASFVKFGRMEQQGKKHGFTMDFRGVIDTISQSHDAVRPDSLVQRSHAKTAPKPRQNRAKTTSRRRHVEPCKAISYDQPQQLPPPTQILDEYTPIRGPVYRWGLSNWGQLKAAGWVGCCSRRLFVTWANLTLWCEVSPAALRAFIR